MRALRTTGAGNVAVAEIPLPSPAAGHSVCRPLLVGLCGTDLDLIDGRVDPAQVSYPLTLGHEWVGTLDHELIVAEGIIGCRECALCRAGEPNLCATAAETGFSRDGAAADRVRVPTHLLHTVPTGVGADNAVLVEPAAVVWRAFERARPAPGARILIIGDGTIGLLAARIARLWQPELVHVRGLRAAQATLVRASGAEAFLREPTAGGYDLVIDAAGSRGATREALGAARVGGTVLLLAYLGTAVEVPLPVDQVINRDLSILGSFASTPAAWSAVIAALGDRRLELDWLITHRFALSEFSAAIHTLREPSGCRGKVVLDLQL